jgi:glycosyltransferase involved in cell wall biosynthesis
MDIDHVSFAPTGGAGLVAKILKDSQLNLGHDSRLLTVNPGDLRSRPLNNPALLLSAMIDMYLIRSSDSASMISLVRRQLESLDLRRIRDTSLVHLHWVEGVINHRQIGRLLDSGRKVVWTLHDMAPFTGGCHSSLGCSGYEDNCGGCPQVRPVFQHAISKSLHSLEEVALSSTSLKLVTPSLWLAELVKSSSVFRGCHVDVINNPISLDFFSDSNQSRSRATLGLDDDAFIGIAVAAQLDNPIKRIPELVDSFFTATSNARVPSKLILVGSNGEGVSKRHKDCVWLGALDSKGLAQVIPAANVLLSASESESAGMTIREAGAMGVPSIVVSNGGSNELVVHETSGYVVDQISEFHNAIRILSKKPEVLVQMGREAKGKSIALSHPDQVAKEYMKIYESIES